MSPGSLADFFEELKRRKVFRAFIGYALAAWVLIQVAETTFPYLGLPDRAVTIVIVLAVAGVPVALVLAWIFDITPRGLQPTADAEARPGPDESSGIPPPLTIQTGPPNPATQLVGRAQELEELKHLLQDAATRVLTLVGPGGSGKTRLALELARELRPNFRDGVAWVSLEAVRDPDLVPSAVGRALGVGESGEEEITVTIGSLLRRRRILLVLDNFEQVLRAASLVAALVEACPDLRVLVTSRAPLRVRGEREFPLSPLSVAPTGRSPAELMRSPAVRLFEERARDMNPRFRLTEGNVSAVATICRRLDGLPLALELVAARSKLLSPTAILERLEQRMPVLGEGARDLPDHQRTLHDTIAWSHELLDRQGQVLFRRLAVFNGGFDLDAAEAVASEDLETQLLDVLGSLVDHSLVQPDRRAGRESRFEMLETIRAYATELLIAGDDAAVIRRLHAEHYADLARTAEPELVGPRQADWLACLEEEHDNLRAALDWLRVENPTDALALAVVLRRFWEVRGHLTEGRRRLSELLEMSITDEKIRLKGLYAAGIMADAQEDYAAAQRYFERSLTLHREAGDEWGVANALNNMGVIALRHGDHEAAHRLYGESNRLWRELGNEAAVALGLNNLGNAARLMGRHHEARAALEESLEMQRSAEDLDGCALTLRLLAEVARDEGDAATAAELYQESLSAFRETGNRPQIARSLLELGRLQRDRGYSDEARDHHAEALDEYLRLGSPRGLAETLEALAELASDDGATEEEARFRAGAQSLREGRRPFDPTVVEAARAWATT
ncbi:MAG: tetratricopeptide repeat protein [Longimicrobiales bacterium]|nr:tetratricopeptide repeat protein [Longimicrobiales bacterium]